MRLVPRDQYGQFSSAAAMVSSFFTMISGIAVGMFLDYMKNNVYHGGFFYLRWSLLWAPLTALVSVIFMYITYKYWKKLGGDESYIAPTSEDRKLKVIE
jgi:hypothetical protein